MLLVALLIIPIIAHLILSEWLSHSYFASLLRSFFWIFLILQACIGSALLFQLFLRFELSNFGVMACIGLALLFYVGSILNLLHLANREFLVAAIYFLAVVFIFHQSLILFRHKNFMQRTLPMFDIGLIALVLLLLINCFFAAINTNFNIHDDYHGYLVFPTKLLEMGHLGADPFSERRVVTSLVGGPFLLALGLAGMSWNFIHILDVGLGLVLIILIVLYFRTGSGKLVFASKLTLLLGVALLYAPGVNLTATFIPAALALASWMLFIERRKVRDSKNRFDTTEIVVLALLIFGLIGLKNTFFIYAGLIVLTIGLCKFVPINKNFGSFTIFIFKVGILLFLLLIPSMIDLYSATGTYLYPLFGKGIHASSYGNFSSATDGFLVGSSFRDDLLKIADPYRRTIVLLNIALIFLLLFVTSILSESSRLRYLVFIVVFSCLINILCVGFLIGGYGSFRYIFSTAIASFVFGFLLLLESTAKKKIQIILLILALIFSVNSLLKFTSAAKSIFEKSHFIIGAPIPFERYSSYDSLSKALPLEGKILARLDLPFLLSYSRRNVFIADYPGSASPAPGMPFRQGPESLVKYLQEQNIDYLVWDYGKQANFSIEVYGDRLAKSTHPWIRSEAEHAFDFQTNLEEIRKSWPVIYDANGFAIIDIRIQ